MPNDESSARTVAEAMRADHTARANAEIWEHATRCAGGDIAKAEELLHAANAVASERSKPSYSFSDEPDSGFYITGGVTCIPKFTPTLSIPVGEGSFTINLETGEVEAPSLEAASEAGRVFVESVRGYLRPEAKVVAWLKGQADYELTTPGQHAAKFAAALYDAADAIERGEHLKPLPEAPEGV